MNVVADQPFGCFALGFFHRSRLTLFTQNIDGLFEVGHALYAQVLEEEHGALRPNMGYLRYGDERGRYLFE